MSAVTRGQLISRVAERANTSGYADTSPGGEVSRLVDISLGKLHNMFVGLYADYFIRRKVIPLVPDQQFYQLPGDLMKLRQVFYLQPDPSAPGDWTQALQTPLRALNIAEVTNPGSSTPYGSYPYGYVLEDARRLRVVPTVQDADENQVLVVYVPEYTPAVSDDAVIEQAFAFGWDEWVVNDVVVQIRLKAGMPVDDIRAERALYEAAVKHQAKQRNLAQPPQVRDTGWGGSPFGGFAITR